MYYEDLSKYCYHNRKEDSYNIGWLGKFHEYNRGDVSEDFLDYLWAYLRYPVNVCRGFHVCELCGKMSYNVLPVIEYKGEKRKIGYYEIRVFSKNGTVYAVPSLIVHYILEHNYRPPQEFIDAVIEVGDVWNEDYYNKILNYSQGDGFWLTKDQTLIKKC